MTTLLVGLLLCTIGALCGAILPRPWRVLAAAVFSMSGCIVAFAASIQVLATGTSHTLTSASVLPLTGINLNFDPLGALFVATTSAVGLAASLFSIGYSKGSLRSRSATCLLPLFIAALLMIPIAASVPTFMVSWELMAITSMLLLIVEHRHRPQARDAMQWYAAMTHVGAAAILLGLILLSSQTHELTFAGIRANAGRLSPVMASLAFLLVLFGFASKAGVVPLHVWLPRAHPEAPSPVSALMSGAMVNLGVYGVVRVGLELLHGGFLWWWLLVIGLGALSALYGALHASASPDLKRLLAYSTIDNIGLIFIGVGASGALEVTRHRELALLAMLASLFHVINHAAFKASLFLAAGCVERATGTRDLDLLGGLAKRLPLLTLLFAIGALSISALPGLNGFASEWLLFESLLHGFAGSSTALVIALLIGVAALALTGGLTAAAFVKALGIGFLGQARSDFSVAKDSVTHSMLAAMVLLSVPCLFFGLVPGAALAMLGRAGRVGLGTHSLLPLRPGVGLDLGALEGQIEPMLLIVGLVGALGLFWTLMIWLSRFGIRRAEAWGCGRELQTARMEYTATSFAEPLGRVFRDVLRPHQDVEMTHRTESRYFLSSLSYQTRIDDGFERSLYRPLVVSVRRWGEFARHIQNGSVHRYLAFSFVSLVVILLVVA